MDIRAQKKSAMAAKDRPETASLERCVDVLVVGAGPAGLAAALDAKAAGAHSVVILDRLPGYSRCRSIIIDYEVLSLLKEWQVDLAGINQVETFSYVHGYAEKQQTDSIAFPRFSSPSLRQNHRIKPGANDILFKRLPRAVHRISDLEEVMLAAARKQGIKVLFNAAVSDVPEITADSVRLQFDIAGESRSINSKYLVIADGARSSLNELFGNRRIPCDLKSYQYTCTVFDSPLRDVLLFWVPGHPSGITEITGLGNGSQYTLVSRLPKAFAGVSQASLHKTRLPSMIKQAAESIGLAGPLVEGPMAFSTDMDRLQEVAIHSRIVCVGDAARKGDPGFGGNLNEAIRDGRRFSDYLSAVMAGQNEDAALQQFRRQVQAATTALQTGGALTNNMRAFFSIGHAAQKMLPRPVRSILHFDVGIMMQFTGAMVNLVNTGVRRSQSKR